MTELAFLGNVVIIVMMRSKTLSAALIWLAALALAAQGFGAPAFLDACGCQACECGEQPQKKSCCEIAPAQAKTTTCGQSCCQVPSRNCAELARLPGSCCCVEADQSVPANLPINNKTSPKKPLPQVAFVEPAAASAATAPVIQLTVVRHESPPPRILYCVWRI